MADDDGTTSHTRPAAAAAAAESSECADPASTTSGNDLGESAADGFLDVDFWLAHAWRGVPLPAWVCCALAKRLRAALEAEPTVLTVPLRGTGSRSARTAQGKRRRASKRSGGVRAGLSSRARSRAPVPALAACVSADVDADLSTANTPAAAIALT